ncbi:hypothetical protein [Heyndrickxia camelliae]|uniref:Uncharacterized protein n=1 Tax=Heyndrickxia camelliae TaxID=1707093 RepID=A0A2N3LFV4_9BACI|nr:hypothetical protein [Heyndrickxia camelliae]PKR83510.1 hypothetical protein CWO92_18250 [Heyndrickxia camelliae]
MSQVILWVDQTSFKRLVRGEEFAARHDQSTMENIQIIVPTSAVSTFEEKEDGIQFNIFKKELW